MISLKWGKKMVVIGNETDETESQNVQESQQNAKLDALQSAVDSLNSQVSAINASITAINASIDDKYSAQTQTLMQALTSQINALSASISSVVSTAQVSANVGNFERLAATLSATLTGLTANVATITEKATVEEAEINTLDVNTEDVGTLQANIANLETANIELLNVTSFVVATLTAENLSAENVDAGNIDADVVDSDKIKAKNITGKDWHTPISTPDNTQLLKIMIPSYQGIIQMQTEENEINLTIGNNSVVSFTQTGNYIFRIERNEYATVLYLMNIGDTINYRVLYVGAETYMEATSELVDRTAYEQNVSGEVNDIVFFSDSDEIFRVGDLGEKQNKELSVPVAIGGINEYTVEGALSRLAGLLNAALVSSIYYDELTGTLYFPYNSVAYDEETESLTVSGLNQVYANETLWFSLV